MAKYRFNFVENYGDSYKVVARCYFVTTEGSTTPYNPSGTTFADIDGPIFGAGYGYENAYLNTGNGMWHSGVVGTTGSFKGEVDYGSNDPELAEVVITLRGDGNPQRGPKTFSVEKWDGSAWVEQIRYENIATWSNGETRRFALVQRTVAGVIRDASGSPAERVVRLYRRDTGAFLVETTSDGSTGAYSATIAYAGEVQRIVLDDDGVTLYNDIVDRVFPG